MKKFGILLAIAALAIVLSGCGEKIVENAIESSTNGNVSVDIDNNSVVINTNGSSLQVGGDISLPSDFPEDVYVIDGTITSSLTLTEPNGFQVIVSTNQSSQDARSTYQNKLAEEGWSISGTFDIAGGWSIAAEKVDRVATVSASVTEGATSVIITVTDKS